jgi:hypothetical protein
MSRLNPLERSIFTKKKVKDGKIKEVLPGGVHQWKKGGHKEWVKEGEYGGCVLQLRIIMEQ